MNKETVGVNTLPKTVTRQRRYCDLDPGPSVPESSTLTTRLPSHASSICGCIVQRELKGRLVDLDDVEHSLDDTIGYLQQVETDLHQLDQVYGDPHFIDAHINRVQVTTATFYMVPAAFPAQHLRPSGVLGCWPDGLELSPGFYPGSHEQHRLF